MLLLSAQQALLSRLVLEGKSDQESLSRFGRLAFGSRAHRYTHSDYLEAAEEMQIDSGLAALEETVLGFLYAHSGSLKLLALLDDTVRMLQQVLLLHVAVKLQKTLTCCISLHQALPCQKCQA